ncbi:MAG: 50S ribosomal protein L15, partial [Desulfovibrionales bacterium]
LFPFEEERKNRKRVGRGSASGLGKTSGKGHKGQNSRSGGGVKSSFEGGQMPLRRRLPKRGFNNIFKVTYQPLSISRMDKVFADKSEITLEDIYARGLASRKQPVKILADGEISRAIRIEAHKFSRQAVEKIKKAGGEAVSLEG